MAKDKKDAASNSEFKGYGDLENGVRKLSDIKEQSTDFITTGSLIFDIFLGGGFCPGISRFMGEPEHGKTAQALTWAKNWLNHYGDKGKVYYFDVEGRVTYRKLQLAGIDKIPNVDDRFIIVRRNVFDSIATFIRDKIKANEAKEEEEREHYFFVFDSLDLLITEEDLKKGFSDAAKVGAAQVMSTLMMKHFGVFFLDKGHHLHILSQIRANINTSNPNSPKTKMSGANALRHGSDITAEIQKNFGGANGMYIFENPNGATVQEKGNIIGHYFTPKFVKTPNEKTGQTIRVPIKRGSGIWREREVTDLALAFGQIRKKGAWYQLEDKKEGWANKDWIDRINKDLTQKAQERYVVEAYSKLAAEAKEAGKELSKAQSKELNEKLVKEAEKNVKFEVETTWQGYPALFSYIEKNPDLVDWLDKEFRSTLLSDSVVANVAEDDVSFE
jgi:RecA/RadA recombinase